MSIKMASHITDYLKNANLLNSKLSNASTSSTRIHLDINTNQETTNEDFVSKKKHVLKVATVKRWINDNLAKDNSSI